MILEHAGIMGDEYQQSEAKFFYPDTPVDSPDDDKFDRSPFAKGIAKSIIKVAERGNDTSCIIYGINGKWGEGKTTVLNFIYHELTTYNEQNESDKIICVRFNPWRYDSTDVLLLNYFSTLFRSMNKKIKSHELGNIIKNYSDYYGFIAAAGSIAVSAVPYGSIVEKLIPKGEDVKNIGEHLSKIDPEEQKNKLNKILKDEKKRVVILIDDIDRLDKTEIQSLFKFIKLTADFDNTIYILAYDKERVSEALGEIYGSEEKYKVGSNYIDKIVQVHLDLPKAPGQLLTNYCIKYIYLALDDAGVKPSEFFYRQVRTLYTIGLEVRVKNARMATRYSNALLFALPALADEVDPIDIILLEGMRIFYRDLYLYVRDYSKWLCIEGYDHYRRIEPNFDATISEGIDASLSGLNNEEKMAGRRLLAELFPNILHLLDGSYTPHREKDSSSKRLCHSNNYEKYFLYAIPSREVTIKEYNKFMYHLRYNNKTSAIKWIKINITNNNSSNFLDRLSRDVYGINWKQKDKLVDIIASSTDLLFNPNSDEGPFSTAPELISSIIYENLNTEGGYTKLKKILQETNSALFAYECYNSIHSSISQSDAKKASWQNHEEELSEIVVQKIKRILVKERKPVYFNDFKYAGRYFAFIAQYDSIDSNTSYIEKTFTDPIMGNGITNVIEFLNSMITHIDGHFNKHRDRILNKDTYDFIDSIMQTSIIYDQILKANNHDISHLMKERDIENKNEKNLHSFCKFYLEAYPGISSEIKNNV